jgi:hypothetical protein
LYRYRLEAERKSRIRIYGRVGLKKFLPMVTLLLFVTVKPIAMKAFLSSFSNYPYNFETVQFLFSRAAHSSILEESTEKSSGNPHKC